MRTQMPVRSPRSRVRNPVPLFPKSPGDESARRRVREDRRHEIARVIRHHLLVPHIDVVLRDLNRQPERDEAIEDVQYPRRRGELLVEVTLHPDAVNRRLRIEQRADRAKISVLMLRINSAVREDSVVVDEEPRLRINLMRELEGVREDAVAEHALHVGVRHRFVHDIPLGQLPLERRDLLADVPEDSLPQFLRLVLQSRCVLRKMIPPRPKQTVAAHRHTRILQPAHRIERALAVALELRPFQIILDRHAIERSHDHIAIHVRIRALIQQRRGRHRAPESVRMALLPHANLRPRERAPAYIRHHDEHLRLPVFLDAVLRLPAPRRILRAALVAQRRVGQLPERDTAPEVDHTQTADLDRLPLSAALEMQRDVAGFVIHRRDKRHVNLRPRTHTIEAKAHRLRVRRARKFKDERALRILARARGPRPENRQHHLALLHTRGAFCIRLKTPRRLRDFLRRHPHRLLKTRRIGRVHMLRHAEGTRLPERERHAFERARRAHVAPLRQLAEARILRRHVRKKRRGHHGEKKKNAASHAALLCQCASEASRSIRRENFHAG